MKLNTSIIIVSFICLVNFTREVKVPIPSVLSNKEIKEVMKCFGDLDLEEACVICRYVTGKINKILDLSTTCPDSLQFSIPFTRSRSWTPDNKVISKWNTLYNEQQNLNNKEQLAELSIFQKSIGDIEPNKPIGQSSFVPSINRDTNINYINDIIVANKKETKKPIDGIDIYSLKKEESIFDSNNNQDNSKILENKARSFFDKQDKFELEPKKELLLSSFIETESSGSVRRETKRTRFPDVQWECAKSKISKLTRYLCEEEVSSSYQQYCRPIIDQINIMIESFLYHDNDIEICQNLHMCPV